MIQGATHQVGDASHTPGIEHTLLIVHTLVGGVLRGLGDDAEDEGESRRGIHAIGQRTDLDFGPFCICF